LTGRKNIRIKYGAPMEMSEDVTAPNASSGWEEEDIV